MKFYNVIRDLRHAYVHVCIRFTAFAYDMGFIIKCYFYIENIQHIPHVAFNYERKIFKLGL